MSYGSKNVLLTDSCQMLHSELSLTMKCDRDNLVQQIFFEALYILDKNAVQKKFHLFLRCNQTTLISLFFRSAN